MYGSSRLGSGGDSGSRPTPPQSPRFRHGRLKSGIGALGLDSFIDRLLYATITTIFRRRGLLLFAPILYFFGMLLYAGSLGFDIVIITNTNIQNRSKGMPLGAVYRSRKVFEKLWPYMEADTNASAQLLLTIWSPKFHEQWKPCSKLASSQTGYSHLPRSNGFFIVEANGGLNQQRLSISDAVAVAEMLNATLLIPIFHLNSVWRDSSTFAEIFDEEYFVNVLKNHVNIARELPEDVLQQFDNNISSIVNLRVKAWSTPAYYQKKVLPKLLELGAVRVAPFSNRLSHGGTSRVQGIRCLANFEALKFSNPIRTFAETMVKRMVKNSSQTGGKYVSVHLRFEEDMVAFSCCVYEGTKEEKRELDAARERGWRGKFDRKGRGIRPGIVRMDGKCPLTPLEVGMMLRAMGFDNTTSVYVAAGRIYKAEKYMAPLRQMFPHVETKFSLALPDELAHFEGHSSRLAALDYTVCLHSEVFVTTQGGNFPHFLIGHRRYLYGGHAKTFRPDKRKLARIFDNPKIGWDDFKRQVRDMLRKSDVKGGELRRGGSSLYTFPMPDCMCKNTTPRVLQVNTTSVGAQQVGSIAGESIRCEVRIKAFA